MDSGNLAACLIALRQGCYEMAQTPVINWEGLLDTLGMLSLSLQEANLGQAANELNTAIASLQAQVQVLDDSNQFSPILLMKLFEEGQVELEAMLWEAIQQSDEDSAPETTRRLSIWIDRVRHQLRRIRIDIQVLAPWLLALANMPDQGQPETKTAFACGSGTTSIRVRHKRRTSVCLTGAATAATTK